MHCLQDLLPVYSVVGTSLGYCLHLWVVAPCDVLGRLQEGTILGI